MALPDVLPVNEYGIVTIEVGTTVDELIEVLTTLKERRVVYGDEFWYAGFGDVVLTIEDGAKRPSAYLTRKDD